MYEELLSGFSRSSQVRAIFFFTIVTLLTQYSAVEVVYLDLVTLKFRLLLSLNAQDSSHDNGLLQPRLSGDLAAVGVNGEDSVEIIVMNWKTKSFFFLPMPHVRSHSLSHYHNSYNQLHRASSTWGSSPDISSFIPVAVLYTAHHCISVYMTAPRFPPTGLLT